MPASNFHRQFGNPFDPRFHTRCYSQRPDFFKWFLHANAIPFLDFDSGIHQVLAFDLSLEGGRQFFRIDLVTP
jgi:hypothetical protein